MPARRKNNDPPVSGAANSSQAAAVSLVALSRLRVMSCRRDIPGWVVKEVIVDDDDRVHWWSSP